MTPDERLQANLARGILVDPDDEHLLRAHLWSIDKKGYASRVFRSSAIRGRKLLHRMIAGAAVDQQVDHVNGHRSDNRRLNLRLCSCMENRRHERRLRGGSSRFKGVSWHRGRKKWQVRIGNNITGRFLGLFDSEQEAADAYDRAAIEMFGEFAATNKELCK